jgi:SAM-dependent methyltransferase
MSDDAILPFSPAAERNRGPILDVLERLLPAQCRVLEIASGTGQHAEHFAQARPLWRWQPSDGDASALPGIAARCTALANVAAPLHLDLLAPPWPASLDTYDAVYCANMLHISPWPTCAALMSVSARCLALDGVLVIYGPFIVDGEPTAPSNSAFDASLRSRDPRWGLRLLSDVTAEARAVDLRLAERIAMPANNLTLVFRRG